MQVNTIEEYIEDYQLTFADKNGCGYGFDSDVNGQIIELGQYARTSLACAIEGYNDGEYVMSIKNYSQMSRYYEGTCECGESLVAYGGYDEFSCDCGAEYNIWGQRLRSGWRDNPSNWDEDVDDMEGYEIEMLRKERLADI